MVKINSIIGMKLKGKLGDFIFQDVNGEQVLRQGYKEKNEPTKEQIQVRDRFRLAAAWVKSLDSEHKSHLRQYYKLQYPSYVKGNPSTWYNWAKTLVMTIPRFKLLDESSNTYVINHPAILSVKEYDSFNNIINYTGILSDILSDIYVDVFKFVPNEHTSLIKVTLISGVVYEFAVPGASGIVISFPC